MRRIGVESSKSNYKPPSTMECRKVHVVVSVNVGSNVLRKYILEEGCVVWVYWDRRLASSSVLKAFADKILRIFWQCILKGNYTKAESALATVCRT